MAEVETTQAQIESRRPLSPHLEIYRPTLTMTMSIAHRISGAALYLGTLLFAWYFIAEASGPRAFAVAEGFLSGFFGRLILFGFTWALFHHMLGGVRHALWDAGYALESDGREFLAKATLIGGIVLTFLVWAIAYAAR